MKNTHPILHEILDQTKLVETRFVRKSGKLRMIRSEVSEEARPESKKSMFPISKERK